MNTLSRAISAQILGDPTSYDKLRQHWRDLICSSRKYELTAAHHLLYLALIGKDWRRGFSCVTNQRKLDSGAFYGWVLFRAIAALHAPSREQDLLAPFDGLVTPAMLHSLRPLIPIQNTYAYRPEQFTSGFPFEAYCVSIPA